MSELHKDETTSLVLIQDTSTITASPLIKQPGDSIEQHMSPKGDVITRVKTEGLNATHRQYNKKDGTKGKQVLILKQKER